MYYITRTIITILDIRLNRGVIRDEEKELYDYLNDFVSTIYSTVWM